VLDCTVYAVFCTHALGLHTYTQKMWDRLESAVQPVVRDLFAPPEVAEPDSLPAMPPPQVNPSRARRRVGRINPWSPAR
jgi:terminase, large subunit